MRRRNARNSSKKLPDRTSKRLVRASYVRRKTSLDQKEGPPGVASDQGILGNFLSGLGVSKKEKNKDSRLKRTYGITLLEWKSLFVEQEGKCAICHLTPATLHLDHKHQPKERQLRKKKEQLKIRPFVRGLLCWRCNSAIAKFRDNPVLLRSAADYVENPPARNIIKIKD